jgi:hypothetical protein
MRRSLRRCRNRRFVLTQKGRARQCAVLPNQETREAQPGSRTESAAVKPQLIWTPHKGKIPLDQEESEKTSSGWRETQHSHSRAHSNRRAKSASDLTSAAD